MSIPKETRIGEFTLVPSPRPDERADETLFDADPDCCHEIVALWSGVKCSKCPGWYCL